MRNRYAWLAGQYFPRNGSVWWLFPPPFRLIALYKNIIWALVIIAGTLVIGRFFCGWICPLGLAQPFLLELQAGATGQETDRSQPIQEMDVDEVLPAHRRSSSCRFSLHSDGHHRSHTFPGSIAHRFGTSRAEHRRWWRSRCPLWHGESRLCSRSPTPATSLFRDEHLDLRAPLLSLGLSRRASSSSGCFCSIDSSHASGVGASVRSEP